MNGSHPFNMRENIQWAVLIIKRKQKTRKSQINSRSPNICYCYVFPGRCQHGARVQQRHLDWVNWVSNGDEWVINLGERESCSRLFLKNTKLKDWKKKDDEWDGINWFCIPGGFISCLTHNSLSFHFLMVWRMGLRAW